MITKAITGKGTSLKVNDRREGEPLERAIDRALNNGENLKGDGASLIHTPRKDGVNPAHDIRTDRFEIAVDAMSKVDASYTAKREERHNPKVIDLNPEGENGKAEPTQTT